MEVRRRDHAEDSRARVTSNKVMSARIYEGSHELLKVKEIQLPLPLKISKTDRFEVKNAEKSHSAQRSDRQKGFMLGRPIPHRTGSLGDFTKSLYPLPKQSPNIFKPSALLLDLDVQTKLWDERNQASSNETKGFNETGFSNTFRSSTRVLFSGRASHSPEKYDTKEFEKTYENSKGKFSTIGAVRSEALGTSRLSFPTVKVSLPQVEYTDDSAMATNYQISKFKIRPKGADDRTASLQSLHTLSKSQCPEDLLHLPNTKLEPNLAYKLMKVNKSSLKTYFKRKLNPAGTEASTTHLEDFYSISKSKAGGSLNRRQLALDKLANETNSWKDILIDNTAKGRKVAAEEAEANRVESAVRLDSQIEELRTNLSRSLHFNLKQLGEVDADFARTTIPPENFTGTYKILRKMGINRSLSKEDVCADRAEIEDLLTCPVEVLQNMPVNDKVNAVSQMLSIWIDMDSPEAPLERRKISKAMTNLFKMVHNSLSEFKVSEEKEPDFIPIFFEICDKLIQKEIEAEKNMKEVAPESLTEVCSAMNFLINSMRNILIYIPEPYLINLVKGYLQNLFLVMFDLTQIHTDEWYPRLNHIGYKMLTIPENIDIFFSTIRIINILAVEVDFFHFFNRFYTCILSLIIKSETFSTTDLHIWKFILDLYSIHFIFMKSAYLNLFCRKSMESLRDVNPENILLRYIALVSNIPIGHLIYSEIQYSLQFNYVHIGKMYQNTSLYSLNRITHIHKAIIKQIFSLLFEFINKRYGNESEQRPVLLQITAWMKILSNYINYNRHYSPATSDQSSAVHLFKSDFQELLFRIKKRRTIASNEVWASECYRLILEACDGMK
jgi:hypothetical protein